MFHRLSCLTALIVCLACIPAAAQSRQAPPGMFRDLDDAILGNAVIVRGKQLFISTALFP